MNPHQQQYYDRCVHPRGMVRENFNGCNGDTNCLSPPQMARVQETGDMQTPCKSCTSIYNALKNRSPYDRMYLRSYNRLPAHYSTGLDSLVFAP
jgi:hypothetical protein